MLRLNMTIAPSANPSRFGLLGGDLAGFPNGRRLADDVVDIAERVVAGATPFTPQYNVAPNNSLGDGVDYNDRPFLPSFPYVALPHSPFAHEHHPEPSRRLRRRYFLASAWGERHDPVQRARLRRRDRPRTFDERDRAPSLLVLARDLPRDRMCLFVG